MKQPDNIFDIARNIPVIGLILLTLRHSAFSFCPVDSCGYLFRHRFFNSAPWDSIIKKSDIIIPDNLCDLKPDVYSVSRHAKFNTSAFISSGNQLYIMTDESYIADRQQCPCCLSWIEFYSPVNISVQHISLSRFTPLLVLSQGKSSYDTARIIIRLSPDKLEVMDILTATGTIYHRDTLSFSLKSGQGITGLHTAFNTATFSDTALWVTGSAGMIRRVPVINGLFGSLTTHDITITDTILCWGGSFAGTSSGKIYRFNNSSFVLNGQAPNPVRYIDGKVACGDNGTIAARVNNAWKFYTVQSTDYRYAAFTSHIEGSGINLLSDTWKRVFNTYKDSPTVIDSITPSLLEVYINNPVPYAFKGMSSMDIRITSYDDDGNHTAPSVVLRKANRTTISLNSDGTYQLPSRDPNMSCIFNQITPADNAMTIKLTASNVTVQKECFLGGIDLSCGACSNKPYLFTVTKNTVKNDTLVFSTGTDTLRIILSDQAVGVNGNIYTGEMPQKDILFKTMSGNILINPEYGNTIKSADIYDSRGRFVNRLQFTEGICRALIPTGDYNGMLFVRIKFVNGMIRNIKIINTR